MTIGVGTLLDNPDDILKQMEAEAAKEAGTVEDEGGEEDEVKDPETEAETDDEGGEDEDEETKEPKKQNAFARMRHENKELAAKWEAAEKQRQEMAERLARLEGRTEAQPKAPVKEEETDQEPDRLMYPEDHNAWQIRQLRKQQDANAKILEEVRTQAVFNDAMRGMALMDQQFKVANPKSDLDGALNYLIDKEKAIKKVMNPNLSDAQIAAQVEVERVKLYASLNQSGRNPAEVVYQIAKQHGFVEKSTEQPTKKTDLAMVEKNQRRATNLIGGSPASKDNGKVNSDDILAMSFQKLLNGSRRNPTMFDVEGE